MRRLIIGLFSLTLLHFSSAHANLTKRDDVQFFINSLVKYHGFKREEVLAVMDQVELQPKVIESISHPYENKTWDIYKQLFLTDERVKEGLNFWIRNQKALQDAEKTYGIPPEVIIATIGIETIYGKHQGDYRVLDALSTLAFEYPPRSAFFSEELTQYFLLCREQKVAPTYFKGSYAGAMGKTQFMPSSYRNFAVDYTHKGRSDLINDDADAIASVANYYAKHHWIPNQPIAEPVDINGTRYKSIDMKFKSAEYFVKDLMLIGIKPTTNVITRPPKAGLLELINTKYKEYWMVYPNFYVITRYNTSPQYAMAVKLLAEQLRAQYSYNRGAKS